MGRNESTTVVRFHFFLLVLHGCDMWNNPGWESHILFRLYCALQFKPSVIDLRLLSDGFNLEGICTDSFRDFTIATLSNWSPSNPSFYGDGRNWWEEMQSEREIREVILEISTVEILASASLQTLICNMLMLINQRFEKLQIRHLSWLYLK